MISVGFANRFRAALMAMAILAANFAAPVHAQSTAQPVLPGYLTTTGCRPGETACFAQYGPNGGGIPNTYALLTNASATGAAVSVTGGGYILNLSGTFGGSTVAITSTVNGVTTTLGSYTSAPATAPCLVIGSGSTVQATVTGGAPSGLYATLSGVGPGGCSGSAAVSVTVTPSLKTTTQTQVTLGSAGVYSQALASSGTRAGCTVQNTSSSDNVTVVFASSTPSNNAPGIILTPYQSITCAAGLMMPTDSIYGAGVLTASDTLEVTNQ